MALEDLLVKANRPSILRFLAAAIGELTLAGRYAYGAPDAERLLMRVNEATHRVSGHLRDLCDPDAPLTATRAEGIAEAFALIGEGNLSRVLSHSPL